MSTPEIVTETQDNIRRKKSADDIPVSVTARSLTPLRAAAKPPTAAAVSVSMTVPGRVSAMVE